MDEDLKIVLTSELEADEEASAQRISAQLPNIAKLINSKSSIKVGVTLDEAGIQSQTQRITQQIARATKSQSVGVSLSLDQSSVNKIKTELNNLKVSPDISRAMTDQLDQMGIQIDRITGRWEAVNGEEERMLNLTIQGTDQMQRTVTYLQTYNAETGEINTHLTNVTANLERQRREQEQVAAQVKKDNESRVSYLNRQKALLADIQAAYVGQTSVKPITDSAHLTALNDTYAAVNARIETMIAAEGRLDNVQRSNLEAQISGLQRLVKEYQNAEYVATKLRTKDIGSIKADQLSGLEALEKRLESAGTLTDTFKSKIDGLKKTLQGVGTKDQLVAFLNSFDQLNNDVAVFQERLRGVNKIYTQLISLDKQITSVQSSMTKLNTSDDKNKLLALQGQLSVLNNQRAALEAQLVPYADIIQYAKQATALEQSRLLNGTQLVYTQMELADKARDYDVAMQSIPSTIADLQTKFSQVVAPTENLVQNMRLLRETAAQYGADMGDREKVATYERLQSLIGACSKEMSGLLRVQRGDVNDFKFTQNLEKAKADLETVGRTWSALKQDPGLNAQFQQLSENLKRVDNQMDLRKWTAQFSTFKSEVKAAGKNMQSLGDILKNNVGKVLQWVSATTLLFRAFRLLRSALTTIVDLDTAMIDLQKVTTATREEYNRFYHSANGTAKALGVTTEEVISQTAEWARLGYAMQDAAKLAENSAIFEAISPDMDITQATDGLVSIIKAYDLDVEDSLDGIISKVNEVGNKFAVSNGDIVEAMTRSSAAMAAANNTFEETVALATAAIEITRDAATVGNGLKTLSMRIRGYDEETEEYSADVSELTGTIADLTKVASNNNRGISLFEADDPETYRSTYDILSDIADIWDELTDKNRANLLEALFGKRQAQIGAAILSNFDQARSAIVKMEESAGSAGREMDKITQSLDYKLNALKETWVGVAQNLFQTDDMKLVVDALNLVSNGIDQLTEKLGLFGTIGLVGAIALIYKFRAEMNMLQSTVLPVTEAIRASGVVMDGSATSVQYYATKLMGLDKSQRAAAMSALGLTAEQKKQVMTMTSLIASAQRYTIQELAEKAATDKTTAATLAKNMAKATEKRTTEQITAAMMTEILNSKKLTAAQKEAIVAALRQTAANEKQAFSLKVLGANAKAAFAAMATNPMTWITLAVTAVMALAQVWQSVKQRAEEARQSMTEAAEVANDQRNSLADLIAEYKELATAGDFDSSARETAKRIQKDITDLVGAQADNLDLVNGKLDDEIKKLDNIKLQAAYDARDTLDTKYRDAMSRYNQGINAEGSGTNFLGVVTDAGGIDQILRKIGYVNDAWENVNGQISISYALAGKNAEEVLAMYKELQHVLLSDDSWQSMADSWLGDSSQDVLNNVQRQIEFYQGLVDDYNSAQENFLKNEAVIDLGETLKTTDINTQDAFDGYIQGIKDSTEYSEAYKKILLELANDTFPEFSGAMQQATNNGGTSVYIAQLEKLTDVISGLRSSYDALASAESDMAGGGGLSAETIESLAGAEEKYLDYLYEENGVVKLNTAAWKENAKYQLRIVDNMIAMTDDGWKTAKLGIGRFYSDAKTGLKDDKGNDILIGETWGINTELLAGSLIIGNNLVLENANDNGVMQFKVDATGAWLYNASYIMQHDDGGLMIFDPKYGIVAGNKLLFNTNGTTVTPEFIDDWGDIKFDADGMPENANFYLDLRDGSAYFRGRIKADSGSIGGWELAENELHCGSNSTFVALNSSKDTNSLYAIWAGATKPENAKFWVKRDGTLHARDGEFSGTLSASRLSGNLTADPQSGGWLKGCGIDVNNGAFYVDPSGNVTMKGSINMADGSITWGSGNSPCLVLYCSIATSPPTGSYNSYPSRGSTSWHKSINDGDLYASYTYDGGVTWTSAIKIRGEDGQNGKDGQDGMDGSDATVNERNVFNVLTNGGTKFGVFSDSSTRKLYINANYIRAGQIDADLITLGSDYGGFCCARGSDGVSFTYGAKMYGSDDEYYFIATNKGVRMQAPDHGFTITNNGLFADEEISVGSDRRLKQAIEYRMDKYENFFMKLKPAQYQLKAGKSKRLHTGFIAQDVERALLESGLTTNDFAGLTITPVQEVNPKDGIDDVFYRLRYGEFISLNTYMIQTLYRRISELEEKIKSL